MCIYTRIYHIPVYACRRSLFLALALDHAGLGNFQTHWSVELMEYVCAECKPYTYAAYSSFVLYLYTYKGKNLNILLLPK